MPRLALATIVLALGLTMAIALAACGSEGKAKLLPGTTARQITKNVASVRSLAAEGECVAAQDAAQAVGNQIDDLREIDASLKEALQKGAERLNEVVLTCTEETEEETEESVPTTTETTTPTKPHKAKPGPEKQEEGGEETEQPPTPKPEQEAPKGNAKGQESAPPEATPQPPSGGIGPGSEAGGAG